MFQQKPVRHINWPSVNYNTYASILVLIYCRFLILMLYILLYAVISTLLFGLFCHVHNISLYVIYYQLYMSNILCHVQL